MKAVVKKLILKFIGKFYYNHFVINKRLKVAREFTINKLDKTLIVPNSDSDFKLGIIGGCAFLYYIELGYDWIGPYYNPLKLFKEVHYFQNVPSQLNLIDMSYPFYIHYYKDENDIVDICRKYNISILRGYDSQNGRIAISVAKTLDIPSVISIH